eukprot:TRINITY_DN4257_c0_g1_i1.p3 TRINITY_DN4257_c0_g1~~TRINITY_DN4257_c0_g1_i1.p3  ORF type:complete len:79 (+),score=17.64 TRINITY_DN4257_c0_g1_i1:52-288(+)
MISPKRMVGTDKTYACIHHNAMHPKDINGTWQVFDTKLRKFTDDPKAMVSEGRGGPPIELRGFTLEALNGVYKEWPLV